MKSVFFLTSFIFFSICTHVCVSQSTNPSANLEKGKSLLLMGQYDEALSTLMSAKERSDGEGKWEEKATASNLISELYLELFEIDKSKQFANEALSICKSNLPENNQQEANALNNLGNAAFSTGQHEKALDYFNEALSISEVVEKTGNESQLKSAPTNIGIGNVFFSKLEYPKAFEHFQQALDVNKSILGEHHPYVANSYLSIGNLHRNTGSFKQARENYDKALVIYLEEFGASHPSIGLTYVGIADIYKSIGSYGQAIQYYNKADGIFSEFFDPTNNPKFGVILLGQADISKNQGDYDTALKLYSEALELYKKTVGDLHQNTVRSYLGIANTYIYQEKFREALDYYGKVLDINFSLVGDNHENTSATYNNLGSLYYFAGIYELSERYFRKAIKIDEALHGKKHPNVANTYYNIARIYGEKGETKTALENVQLAINASILGFDDESIFVNPALLNFFDSKDLLWYISFKGQMLEEGFAAAGNMKGLDLAIHSFMQSDSLVTEIRRSYTDRKDEIALAKLTSQIYQSAVNSCFTALEILNEDNVKDLGPDANYLEKKKEYQNRFFYFSEKKKGAKLFSSLAEANAKSFGDMPNELIVRDDRLKQDLSRFTREISFTTDEVRLKSLQDSLFITNRLYEDLIDQMETSYPRYFEIKYDVSVVSLDDFQSFLSDSTAVISYFKSGDQLYIAVISKDDIDLSKVRLEDDHDRIITAFRNAILFKENEAYLKFGTKLYNQLLSIQIDSAISKLIFVPDGRMATIPFEALPTRNVEGSIINWKTFPFLLNKYAISYTYSANLLYRTFKNEKTQKPKAEKDLLTIAPVVFQEPYGAILASSKKRSYDESGVPDALRKSDFSFGLLPSIPASETEARNIYSMFEDGGKRSEMVLFENATEHRIKSKELETYKYVHIASHGFVNQDEPEFSGIIFSVDSTAENGILFAGEIYGLKLNCEIISLSACETGLGKIKEGEGIIGITRALIYAGAKNVNVSLWKVDDRSTSELMTAFYSHISKLNQPEDKNESIDYARYLRSAKLDIIDRGEYSHPYYWSSFVLNGK